jgi:replicative DNA helicase
MFRGLYKESGIYRESEVKYIPPSILNYLEEHGDIVVFPDDLYFKIRQIDYEEIKDDYVLDEKFNLWKREDWEREQVKRNLEKELNIERINNKKIKINNLKKIREELGLSIRQLAQICSISKNTIIRAEKGKPIQMNKFNTIFQKLLERRCDIEMGQKNSIPPDYNSKIGTPKKSGTHKKSGTPKEIGTPQKVGTLNEDKIPKENETPENFGTPNFETQNLETLNFETQNFGTSKVGTSNLGTLKKVGTLEKVGTLTEEYNGKLDGNKNFEKYQEPNTYETSDNITNLNPSDNQASNKSWDTPNGNNNGKNNLSQFFENATNIENSSSSPLTGKNQKKNWDTNIDRSNNINKNNKNKNIKNKSICPLRGEYRDNINNRNGKIEKVTSAANPKAFLERALIFKIASNQNLLYLADIFSPEIIEPENKELYKTLIEFKKEIETKRKPFSSVDFQIRLGSKNLSEYLSEYTESMNWEVEELLEIYNTYASEKRLKLKVQELIDKDELNYETLSQVLNTLIVESKVEDKTARIDKIIDEFVEKYLEGQEIFETRFRKLDYISGGFKKGQYCIVASRPSVGKTTFLLNLALEFAKKGKKVVFFSLEQSSYEIVHRLVNILAKKDLKNRSEIEEKLSVLCNLNFYIYENIYSVANIEFILKRFHRDADVVIIDYAQLITLPHKLGNIVQEYSLISNNLRRIAKELGILLIVASQLNRDVERRADPKPRLSDLRESGAFEQDSDIVILLSKKQKDKFIAELTLDIAKNRNGATGECVLNFDMPAFYIYDSMEVKE